MTKIACSRTAVLALCLASLVPVAALADSTSSASSAASTSIGSSSASIEKSSNSASGKDRVAQGHYTVVAVADVPQTGLLRVQLQAVASAKAVGTDDPAARASSATTATTGFILTLPRATAERVQLAAGQTIAAELRPYGLAFALVNPATGLSSPFFLVLDDAWFRELESHPVGA